MSAPKISVLIPVFNTERFLAECLESVLAQDFCGAEILISDDGSTDKTPEIIQQFAMRDPRIRWWRNKKNLGQVQNLNLCLREAQGEFIKFVFADDKLLAPDALRRLAEILEKNPSVSLAGSASAVIDEHSNVIRHRPPFPAAGICPGKIMLQLSFEPDFCWKNFIGEPTVVMFRKSQAGRGFNPNYLQIVDLEMWLHLLQQGDFFCLPETLSAWRRHPNQQTQISLQTGSHVKEYARLIGETSGLSCLEIASQKLFNHLHRLKGGGAPPELMAAWMKMLGQKNYFFYWLRRKIFNPFQKLPKSLRKRFRSSAK